MKKLIIVLLILFVAIPAILTGIAFVATSPEYQVERSIVIMADEAAIYPYVSNLEKWPEWTPWTAEKFPGMETTYSENPSGVGATSTWTGEKSGNGTMTITKADPKTGIVYDMTFEGFPTSEGLVRMEPAEGGVKVTMGAKGSVGSNPVIRVLGMFMSMDKMMGKDFEEGLEKLKTVVESKNS